MQDLQRIKTVNNPVRDPAEEYRVQRDRLAQCLRRVLKGDADAPEMATRVLKQIYGDKDVA